MRAHVALTHRSTCQGHTHTHTHMQHATTHTHIRQHREILLCHRVRCSRNARGGHHQEGHTLGLTPAVEPCDGREEEEEESGGEGAGGGRKKKRKKQGTAVVVVAERRDGHVTTSPEVARSQNQHSFDAASMSRIPRGDACSSRQICNQFSVSGRSNRTSPCAHASLTCLCERACTEIGSVHPRRRLHPHA